MKLAVFAHKADAVGDEEALAGELAVPLLSELKADPFIFCNIDEFSTFQMDLEDEIAYAMDQLAATDESLVGLPPPQPTCHLTSIYDFRLALAFSQVIVSALRPAANLSGVLDSWSTVRRTSSSLLRRSSHSARMHRPQASSVDKSFLFDVASKIYVSTDSAPVQPLVHDACVQWLTRLNAENKDFACALISLHLSLRLRVTRAQSSARFARLLQRHAAQRTPSGRPRPRRGLHRSPALAQH